MPVRSASFADTRQKWLDDLNSVFDSVGDRDRYRDNVSGRTVGERLASVAANCADYPGVMLLREPEWNTTGPKALAPHLERHSIRHMQGPNGKDQRLAALWQAITHDDARESFASCGSAYSRPWTFTSQAD